MAVQVTGIVGPAVLSDGVASAPPRQDRSGSVVVSEAHGRYYETTFRKGIFRGANLTAVTTTAAFATAYTGFCLSNPNGSGVNLAVNKVTYGTVVAQTAALILGIMSGISLTNVVHTTPLVVGSGIAGGGGNIGLIDSAATLPVAPTSIFLLDVLSTGAITVQEDGGKTIDMEGSLLIPPGGFAAFYTSAASVASSLVFGMQWEEILLNG